jgi:outer membrane immunogenic protein
VNGGRAGGVVDADLSLFQPPLPPSPGFASLLHTSNRTGGFVVGGQIGYNYQLASRFVLGFETDAQWSDVGQSQHETTATATIIPFASARTTDLVIGLDWFGTSRLRLGYAIDRFLPYVTGGVAYGQVSGGGFQNVLGAGPGVFSSSASRTQAGWAAGAGVESALTERLSLKAEYLYVDIGGVSGPVAALQPPPLPASGSFKTGSFGMHVVRAGLNWKLGGFGGKLLE